MTTASCPATGGFRSKGEPSSTATARAAGPTRLPNRVAREPRARYEGTVERVAVGYVRVSTIRQASEGDSLPAQRDRLQAWATANGYAMAAVHADEGVSGARLGNRPGVQAAIDEACRRRCPLVVLSLSRLVRSTSDAISVGERLSEHGADLVSLSEQIDTTTASGRLVFKLLALLGEFERELVVERTVAVLGHLRDQGRRVSGHLPFGFRLGDDRKHLVEDPAEQAVIVDLRAWRDAGMSLRACAQRLQEAGIASKGGGRRWRPGTIAAILRRNRLPVASSEP